MCPSDHQRPLDLLCPPLFVEMPPKKHAKKVEEEEEEEESEEEESEDEESDENSDAPDVSEQEESDDELGEDTKQEEVIVNFEFFSAKEADYHGLKCLLTSFLDGNQYDCSGLCNSIIKQSKVGSVVKSSEEDDPFAVFTVLSLATHQSENWLEQVKSHMKSSCKSESLRKKLEEAFTDGTSTGLLVNERLMNSPPKLAPPLVQFLFQEIKAATTDSGLSKKERDSFSSLKRYLIFTRVFSDPDRAAAVPSSSVSRKKQKQVGGAGPSSSSVAKADKDVIVYLRPEDEFLHKHASWSFTFGIEGRAVGKDDLQPLRLVMLVEASKIQKVRAELDSVVGNMASGK